MKKAIFLDRDGVINNNYKENKEVKANFTTDILLSAVHILEKL